MDCAYLLGMYIPCAVRAGIIFPAEPHSPISHQCSIQVVKEWREIRSSPFNYYMPCRLARLVEQGGA